VYPKENAGGGGYLGCVKGCKEPRGRCARGGVDSGVEALCRALAARDVGFSVHDFLH